MIRVQHNIQNVNELRNPSFSIFSGVSSTADLQPSPQCCGCYQAAAPKLYQCWRCRYCSGWILPVLLLLLSFNVSAYQVTECWGWSRGLFCSSPGGHNTKTIILIVYASWCDHQSNILRSALIFPAQSHLVLQVLENFSDGLQTQMLFTDLMKTDRVQDFRRLSVLHMIV